MPLPSSKIKDYWQTCACSRGFSWTQSQETAANTSLPPMNAIITSNCSVFNAEYPSFFLVTKHYTSYCAQWMVSMWLGLYYDWATLGELERVGVRVPESVGYLTTIWLELHDFMWQTQNLVLACNPTIRTRDMLGSTQLYVCVCLCACVFRACVCLCVSKCSHSNWLCISTFNQDQNGQILEMYRCVW